MWCEVSSGQVWQMGHTKLSSFWTFGPHDWRFLSEWTFFFFFLKRPSHSKNNSRQRIQPMLENQRVRSSWYYRQMSISLVFLCIKWWIYIYHGVKILQRNYTTLFGIANCYLLIRVFRIQTSREDQRRTWSSKGLDWISADDIKHRSECSWLL